MEGARERGQHADTRLEDSASHVPAQPLVPRLAEVARAFRANPFRAHALLRGGHAQTLAASLRVTRLKLLREERGLYESRLVEVEPGSRVLLKCRWQRERREAPTLLILHGLEGSSESLYVVGTAQKAYRAGFNVVRMNMRTCGGTEHLAPTLYNSGMTGDIGRVVVEELAGRERLPRVYVAGFSMSGNMVLKLAGDYGPDFPPALAGVAAVSPSVDIAACASAVERRANVIYRLSFMRSLRRRVRAKARLHPGLYDARGLRRVRNVWQFDERYTAPHGGYADARDYYERASSLRVIPRVEVPALIIHSADDPIIPADPFLDPATAANPNVLLVVTRGGGHVGFISRAGGVEDRRWAENRVVEFCRMLDAGG
ncbi:MAG TPA: alpha/beta fold hydrolase [Pyrinomonadaceae bacterium]|nr:alpha/beta fold hydrolase [Pyrinomonadaceae bacterium]